MEEEFIPKKPGWYWCRGGKDVPWTPVHLSTTKHLLTGATWAPLHTPDEVEAALDFIARAVKVECTRELSAVGKVARDAERKEPGSGYGVLIEGLSKLVSDRAKQLLGAPDEG